MAPESLPEANDWLLQLCAQGGAWMFVGDEPVDFEPDPAERGDEPDR